MLRFNERICINPLNKLERRKFSKVFPKKKPRENSHALMAVGFWSSEVFGQYKPYFSVELGELYLQTDNSSIPF